MCASKSHIGGVATSPVVLRWLYDIEFTCPDHSPRTLVVTFNRSQVNIGRASTPRSLFYCLFAPRICMVLSFAHIPFVVNHTINATPPERLQQWPFFQSLLQRILWSDSFDYFDSITTSSFRTTKEQNVAWNCRAFQWKQQLMPDRANLPNHMQNKTNHVITLMVTY